MMLNKIALAAIAAIGFPSMAMAAGPNLLLTPATPTTTVSYAAPMSFKPLTTGRTGVRTGKGDESNLDGASTIIALGVGAVIGGVVCDQTDLCGSNGHPGSISP
jgi:hypothetical protein